jgi:hypothetical protein
MLDPSTPCGRATPEAASRPFQGWPTRQAGGLRLSSTLVDTPRRTFLLFSLPLLLHDALLLLFLLLLLLDLIGSDVPDANVTFCGLSS